MAYLVAVTKCLTGNRLRKKLFNWPSLRVQSVMVEECKATGVEVSSALGSQEEVNVHA